MVGAALAKSLRQCWRLHPDDTTDTDALALAEPQLIALGVGPLAWNRIRHSALAETPGTLRLRDAARGQAIRDLIELDRLDGISALLRRDRIPGVVFKGHAAAQAYSATHLRIGSDVDLIVPSDLVDRARAVLAAAATATNGLDSFAIACGAQVCVVDFHASLAPAYRLRSRDLFARALPLGDTGLLMPCAEHHLRIACIHLLKHGGTRPAWLCDVAAMAESAGPEFDWEDCLTQDPFTRSWMLAVLATARDLLGAEFTPPHGIEPRARDWIGETMLREWGGMRPIVRRPGAVLHAPARWIAARWPNPLGACFSSGTGPDTRLRGAAQLHAFAARAMVPALSHLGQPEWWRAQAAFTKRLNLVLGASSPAMDSPPNAS